ncbi:SKA complex subunit 3 [Menidia menidia]
MDPTSKFFAKLRKLAVTLESETSRLQNTFENRNDDDDSESKARGMRAYHDLNEEVGNLKGKIRNELAEQKKRESDVDGFLHACKVMEQRVSNDIQNLRTHLGKYGYQAPCDSQRPTKLNDGEAEEKASEDGTNSAVGEEGIQNEEEGAVLPSPPKMAPSLADAMRTPQLSDFGLSEMQLKRVLAGAEWCSEVPPMPQMSLPHPALNTPPPMPVTPKCALRMDDEELQTPQMHHFGISEHTACLNNDFTMDLFQKNPGRSKDGSMPTMDSVMESLQARASTMASPEPPVFCTPGFKIKKANGPDSPPAQSGGPDLPFGPPHLPSTPEVPAFETPYVNRVVSSKKSARLQGRTPACNGASEAERCWEDGVPDMEMPNLESVLGSSLQNRNGKIPQISETEKLGKDPAVSSLELDGPTEGFSLGTPRIRTNFQEPSTPEMPDLSSVTQDICKLLAQAQRKKTAAADMHQQTLLEKARRSPLPPVESVSVVSQSEFQTLPYYLRTMSLSSLNQAVNNINRFTEEHRGEVREFREEDLKRIINVGTMAPVYIVCLKELRRLTQGLNAGDCRLVTHR